MIVFVLSKVTLVVLKVSLLSMQKNNYFQKVNDMWEMMKYMTDFPPFPFGENNAKIRSSKPVIKVLVLQGKKYLEDRYRFIIYNHFDGLLIS